MTVDAQASPWISTIPTAFAGRVWVGTLSNGVYAVTADGVQAHADVDTPTTPAVRHDRTFAATTDGVVHALSLPDGSETWTANTNGAIHGAPAVASSTLYVGNRNDALVAIDVADGTVFVTTQAGTLTAVVADPN